MDKNDSVGETQNDQQIATKQPFLRFQISLEPLFFILFFCFALTDAARPNLILLRTCTMVFNFSKENCTGDISPSVEETVQPYLARIIMAMSLVEAIFPALLSLFIGSWSDSSKKRKPFIILPLIGLAFDYILWIIFIYLPVPPEYFIICVLPFSLFGGFISIFTCGYSYLSDITNEQNRAFRMSVCSVFLTAGTLSGYLLSSEIDKRFDRSLYVILFGTSLGCMILLLFYTIFLLPEAVTSEQEEGNLEASRERISFFNLSNVKESINVLLKQRPGHERLELAALIVLIVMDILVFQGESSFKFLSLKAGFSWTAQDYNIYAAVLSGTAAITALVGIWLLNKVLGLSEPFIILLTATMSFISSVLLSISKSQVDIYSASMFGCFIILLNPLVKCEMSHLVPSSDIGKILAFTSTLEAIAPFAAAPAYTEVYNIVVTYKPLYLYFLSSAFWLVSILLAIIILTIHGMYGHNYQPLEEVPDNVNESNPPQNPIIT